MMYNREGRYWEKGEVQPSPSTCPLCYTSSVITFQSWNWPWVLRCIKVSVFCFERQKCWYRCLIMRSLIWKMFPSKILHKEKAGFGGFSKFRVECFLGLKSRRTKDQGCREKIRNGCPAHPALYISIPAVSRFAQRKVKKWRAPLRHFQIREDICQRRVIKKSILKF